MDASLKIKIQDSQAIGLASNLSKLLQARRLTENQLAQQLKIPVMTIRRLTSGETIDPHISTLKQIADFFEITIDSLIGLHSDVNQLQKNNKPVFVPILDWETVKSLEDLDDLELSHWKDWQPVVLNSQHFINAKSYALESKPSMLPRFPMGTLFIIDPHAQPQDSDLVLIRVKHDRSLSIREILIDPPKWQLRPTVSGSETIFFDSEKHQIIGTVMLTLLYSRR